MTEANQLKPRRKLRSITSLLTGIALCASLVTGADAQEEPGYFVVNRASVNIRSIELAAPGSDEWGGNLLQARVLKPKERFKLTPPAGICVVDVRVLFEENPLVPQGHENLRRVERGHNVCGARELAFDVFVSPSVTYKAPARQYKGDPPAAPTVPAAPAPTAPQVAAAPAPAAREDSRNRTAQAKSPVRAIRVEVAAFLPSFPWPPPKPSARAELPSSMFVLSSKPAPTLAAVGARLVGALEDARYFEYSFYQAPGGFALVARLERMSNDGTPLPEQFRFLEPASDEPFVLSAYVKQLFFAPEGFYRQIVFVVADVPFTATGAMLDTRGAQRLLGGGANRLSGEFETMFFTPQHRASALIYEFRKGRSDGDVATLTPGRLGVRTHLERAGIYQMLAKPMR